MRTGTPDCQRLRYVWNVPRVVCLVLWDTAGKWSWVAPVETSLQNNHETLEPGMVNLLSHPLLVVPVDPPTP
ncbi:hypothetical protein GN956_G26293 [Arapaima gigas]